MRKIISALTIASATAVLFALTGCSTIPHPIGNDEPTTSSTEHEDLGGLPWVVDIQALTLANNDFRAARWTGTHFQLTVMSIKPGGEVGLEVHPDTDQFLLIEQGKGKVLMGKTKESLTYEKEIADAGSIFVPAGYWHNLINTGNTDLKLYSIYSPPEHPKGTVHKTPEDDEHNQ